MIAAEPIAPPVPRGPAVLSAEHLAIVLAFPDAMLVDWCDDNIIAHEVMTDRETEYALAIATVNVSEAARYIRERLRTGDHVQARARIAMTTGAVLTLGGRRYTVTGRRGAFDAIVVMRGERGGLAELLQPHAGDGRWWLYRGRIGRPNTKHEGYRRDDRDGTFTAAP